MVDAPEIYSWLAFALAALAAFSIFALSGVAYLTGRFAFWPPPSGRSWQKRAFMLLFRLFLYPLIILSVLRFDSSDQAFAPIQYLVGTLFFLIGFGLATYFTLQMGWRNAFGEKKGLRTSGAFAISRNPVYLVTWLGLLGWGLIIADLLVAVLLLAWLLMYVLAPFLEEPWLEEQYGDEYVRYKSSVPRFL